MPGKDKKPDDLTLKLFPRKYVFSVTGQTLYRDGWEDATSRFQRREEDDLNTLMRRQGPIAKRAYIEGYDAGKLAMDNRKSPAVAKVGGITNARKLPR